MSDDYNKELAKVLLKNLQKARTEMNRNAYAVLYHVIDDLGRSQWPSHFKKKSGRGRPQWRYLEDAQVYAVIYRDACKAGLIADKKPRETILSLFSIQIDTWNNWTKATGGNPRLREWPAACSLEPGATAEQRANLAQMIEGMMGTAASNYLDEKNEKNKEKAKNRI